MENEELKEIHCLHPVGRGIHICKYSIKYRHGNPGCWHGNPTAIPHVVCSLLEDEDVVVTGHVGSCYLYDVWVGQFAEHLELMLCVGVANLDGD